MRVYKSPPDGSDKQPGLRSTRLKFPTPSMVVKKFLSLCFPLNFHIHYGSSKALFLPSPHGRDTFHGCSVKDDCCCFWRYFCEMYEDLPETSKCFGKYVSTCFWWGNAEILVSPPSVRQNPLVLMNEKDNSSQDSVNCFTMFCQQKDYLCSSV